MALSRILIANRGEIAVRIQRAAKELGVHTIQVHSSADTELLAVKMADEAVNIGPPQASKSYLNIDALITAAKATNADAVHPGYGFLSENAAFADAVEAAGLVFVGPTGATIRTMGDKAAARAAAIRAGVPVAPGSESRLRDTAQAIGLASEIGYPLMIKAAAGGGGRGIESRKLEKNSRPQSTRPAPRRKRRSATAASISRNSSLGRDISKCRYSAMAWRRFDRFERECSLQRRRQKVWEEAPWFALTAAVREDLCASAVALARSVAYRGAGTLEYLYDDSRSSSTSSR